MVSPVKMGKVGNCKRIEWLFGYSESTCALLFRED